jgi:hypothetical protein
LRSLKAGGCPQRVDSPLALFFEVTEETMAKKAVKRLKKSKKLQPTKPLLPAVQFKLS